MSMNEAGSNTELSSRFDSTIGLPGSASVLDQRLLGNLTSQNSQQLGSTPNLDRQMLEHDPLTGLETVEPVNWNDHRTSDRSSMYGDEFESGIAPIDTAAQLIGKAIGAMEQATEVSAPVIADAIGSAASNVSKSVKGAINIAQARWNDPDNETRKALSYKTEQVVETVKNLTNDAVASESVQNVTKRITKAGRHFAEKAQDTLRTAQDKTEAFAEKFLGRTDLESESVDLPPVRRAAAPEQGENLIGKSLDNGQEFALSERSATFENTANLAPIRSQTASEEISNNTRAAIDPVIGKLQSGGKELRRQIRVSEKLDDSEGTPQGLEKQVDQALGNYQRLQKRDDKLEQRQNALSRKLGLLSQQQDTNASELTGFQKRDRELKKDIGELSEPLKTANSEYEEVVDQLESLTPQAILQREIEKHITEENKQALQALLQLSIPNVEAVEELLTKHRGLLDSANSALLSSNIDPITSMSDLLDVLDVAKTAIRRNQLEKDVAEQTLIIKVLEATRSFYIAERARLTADVSLKRGSVEDLNLKFSQLNDAVANNNSNLASAQSAVDKINRRVAQVTGKLDNLKSNRDSVQQELQDFLDRLGHTLPEAERQVAIAQRLQYVQSQLEKTTDPEEKDSLNQQLDWLKLQESIALESSDYSPEKGWSELIEDLKQRKNGLEKHGKQALRLQRYIQFLNQPASDNEIYLPGDVGELRNRLSTLSEERAELNTVLSGLLDVRNDLKATSNGSTDKKHLGLLQQNAKDIRLFRRVAIAIDYETSELETWANFLEHIDTPAQNIQQQDTAWDQAGDNALSAIATFMQNGQGGTYTQENIDVFKASFQEAVGRLKELSSLDDQKSQLQSLIDFGLLATELQATFFKKHVVPEVTTFIGHLQVWNQSLTDVSETLSQLLQQLQPVLEFDVNFSQFIQEQLSQITEIQTQVQSNLNQLQRALYESRQPLSMLYQQQKIDLEAQLKQNEQQIDWIKEQRAIEQKIQSGNFNPEELYEDLQKYLRGLVRDSSNSLEKSHGFGQELLKLREQQSNGFEHLIEKIQDGLLPEYSDRELAQSELRDSITIIAALKTVHSGLAQTVNTLKNEIEALQLDVEQGKDLQQELAELQERYIESAQDVKEKIDNLLAGIESGASHASQKVSDIEQDVESLYTLAGDADRDAEDADRDANDAKVKSQETRREIALSQFGHKYQIAERFVGKHPVDSSGRMLLAYIKDPNRNWETSGSTWTPKFKESGRFSSGFQTYFDKFWQDWDLKSKEAQKLRNQAQDYRDQAAKLEQSSDLKFWRSQQAQWEVATQISEELKNSIGQIQRLLTVDASARQGEASRASKSLQEIERVFPLISQRFEEVAKELRSAQANLGKDWNAYNTSENLHLEAVLKAINSQSHWSESNLEYQARLDEVEAWADQQNSTLLQKNEFIKTLRNSLREQLTTIETQLADADGDEQDTLEYQKAALQRSLQLVDNTSGVFDLQQGTLATLEKLENSHESISVAEQQLVQDYLNNPDTDGQVLERKLETSRNTLAEVQRLAEQAENNSNALNSFTLDSQNILLETKAEYIEATKQLQPILDELNAAITESIQSAKNLRDAQRNLNSLTQNIKQALDEAVASGDQEAAALRDIATNQSMEEAARIYERSFKDSIIQTKKKYRPLLEEYEAIASRQQENELSAEQQQNLGRLIAEIRPLAETISAGPKSPPYGKDFHERAIEALQEFQDTEEKLRKIAQRGPLEAIQVRLIELEINIQKELQKSKKDGEARHLLEIIHNEGFLAAATAEKEYIERDLQGAKSSRKARYGPLLERFAQDAQHYEGLQAEASADAAAARLARVTAEAKLDPTVLKAPENADIAGIIGERLQINGDSKGLYKRQEEIQDEIKGLGEALEKNLDNQEQIQRELDAALLQQQVIGAMIQQTEQTLNHLLTIHSLDYAQASLEQQIAFDWSADLEQTIADIFQQDLLENQYQKLTKVTDILQIGQQNTEAYLQEALNGIRRDLGMAPLAIVPSQSNQQQQVQTLLKDLQTLQAEQPDLSENLKILLHEVEGDLNAALKGEEAATIQSRLAGLINEINVQNQEFMNEINQLNADNEKDMKLLGLLQGEDVPEGKLQELDSILGEIRDGNKEFNDLMESIQGLRLEQEINSKRIISAEHMIEVSEAIDAQSHELLTGEISNRIQERRDAGKKFWGKIKMGLTIVGGAIATGLTFGGAAPVLALTVSLAVGAMNTIDGAARGDWMGAAGGLLSMGGAVTGFLGQVGTGAAAITAKTASAVQQYAGATYRSIRAGIEGDDLLAVLEVVGGFVSVANHGLSKSLSAMGRLERDISQGALRALQHVPQNLHIGIRAIKNGDWLVAADGLFNTAIGLGQEFIPLLGDSISRVINQADKLGNTGLILAQGAEDDGFVNLQGLVYLYGDDIRGYAEEQKRKVAIQPQKQESQSEAVIQAQKREPQSEAAQGNLPEPTKRPDSSVSGEDQDLIRKQHRRSGSSHPVTHQVQHRGDSLGAGSDELTAPNRPDVNSSNQGSNTPLDELTQGGIAQPTGSSVPPTPLEESLGMSLPRSPEAIKPQSTGKMDDQAEGSTSPAPKTVKESKFRTPLTSEQANADASAGGASGSNQRGREDEEESPQAGLQTSKEPNYLRRDGTSVYVPPSTDNSKPILVSQEPITHLEQEADVEVPIPGILPPSEQNNTGARGASSTHGAESGLNAAGADPISLFEAQHLMPGNSRARQNLMVVIEMLGGPSYDPSRNSYEKLWTDYVELRDQHLRKAAPGPTAGVDPHPDRSRHTITIRGTDFTGLDPLATEKREIWATDREAEEAQIEADAEFGKRATIAAAAVKAGMIGGTNNPTISSRAGAAYGSSRTYEPRNGAFKPALPEITSQNSAFRLPQPGFEAQQKPTQIGKLIGNTKKLTPAEQQVIDELIAQGREVEIIPRKNHKTPDFKIDKVEVELKTVKGLGDNTVKTAIERAVKGKQILIDARGINITRLQALDEIGRAEGNLGWSLKGRVTVWTHEGQISY